MAPKTKAKSTALPTDKPPTSGIQSTKPNWPDLKPLLPPSDLEIETVVSQQILTVSQFWTATLCKTYVNFLRTLPLVTTPGKPKRGNAVRVNDRHQIDDPTFAKRLWTETALQELLTGEAAGVTVEERHDLWGGELVGLNPNIRVYRYTKGQFFDQHYDDFNNVEVDGKPAKTTWTLLLYLSSPVTGCIGGETVFYPESPKASKRQPQLEPVVAELEVGKVLLHKHGRDCMLHEGREVVEGEKWVLRTDLCVKR